MNKPVLMDVDTGIDDAMAILFAVRSPDIDVRAITCVSGNVSVDQVVDNTLAVLELVDAPEVPVARGATRPLIETPRSAAWVHGANGIGGASLSKGNRRESPLSAVELMRSTLLAAEQPVTIVALAPLTNVALLLRTCPEVTDRIERVLFMGGSATTGNATAAAEFNIWQDPEAAHIVLNSGVPLTMYGLDVFNLIKVVDVDVAALAASTAAIDHFLGTVLGFQWVNSATGTTGTNGVLGDAGAVCSLVAPELLEFQTLPVQVELAPGLSRGQTLVDRRTQPGEDAIHDPRLRQWPTAEVALGTDREKVIELFFTTVRAGGAG